jgi:hypothetical protein
MNLRNLDFDVGQKLPSVSTALSLLNEAVLTSFQPPLPRHTHPLATTSPPLTSQRTAPTYPRSLFSLHLTPLQLTHLTQGLSFERRPLFVVPTLPAPQHARDFDAAFSSPSPSQRCIRTTSRSSNVKPNRCKARARQTTRREDGEERDGGDVGRDDGGEEPGK